MASGRRIKLARRSLMTALATSLLPQAGARAAARHPVGADGTFRIIKDWTFGRSRAGATIGNMTSLAEEFRFRYIYDGGKLDRLPTYWSQHRNYPEGDPRSLHVFTDDALVLKGRVPPGGGLRPKGIESGLLRALQPVTPGMYVEMRAKLPHGRGVWPSFWLNPGVESRDGRFSATPWPPEIDVFEFYVWQGRTAPREMESNIQVNGHPQGFGNPHDTMSLFHHGRYEPGIDFSADYHVFALDWQEDLPTWILDGKRIKQTVYKWGQAPPAHILVTNAIGMILPGVDLSGMQIDEAAWDYTIDYIRVWSRT